MLLVDGVEYQQYKPQKEEELEDYTERLSKKIFGEDSLYYSVKTTLRSIGGIGSIPDAYAIILKEPYEWYIIEIEMSSHSIFNHIVPQLNKFVQGLNDHSSRRKIVDTLYNQIKKDPITEAYVKEKINSGEIFRFLSSTIDKAPKLVVVIDEKTRELEEACNSIPIYSKDIVELKVFERQDVPLRNVFYFDSLDKKTRVQTNKIVTDSGEEIQSTRKIQRRHIVRKKFWTALIEKSKGKTSLFAERKPGIDSWIGIGAGKSGVTYNYVILLKRANIELYIDTGDQITNKTYFDKLVAKKEDIEKSFGGPLEWQRMDDKRASRIRYIIEGYGLYDENHWADLHEKMINAMIRLERSLKPYIRNL